MPDRPHDGPYQTRPLFDPRSTSGASVYPDGVGRWVEVDGEWYAFFGSTVGPDVALQGNIFAYTEKHPDSPNFWRRASHDGRVIHPTQYACRHGWMAFKPCPQCGLVPDEVVPEEKLEAARSALLSIVTDLSTKNAS